MAALSKTDAEFLRRHELCRLATATKDGRPHVVPVIYTLDGGDIIVAVDYGTRKLRNLRENRRLALVVDDYRPNAGLMVEGTCEIIERGEEYMRLLRLLFDRFEFYRKDPWGEGESPILKIRPEKCVSW